MKNSEISLQEIFRILWKRKLIIVFTVLLSILAAVIYNWLKAPVYQSTVLMKKEIIFSNETGSQDRLQSILALRSQDELETDMELVHTRTVINKVISDLHLNIFIKNIIEQDGTVTKINLPISEYTNRVNNGDLPSNYPKIRNINLGLKTSEFEVRYKKDTNNFEVTSSNEGIFSSKKVISNLPQNKWSIDLTWGNKVKEITFKTLLYDDVIKDLFSNVFTDKKLKTNIFEIGARSEFPYLTKEIANKLAEKLRANKVELQKDNIKYTFNFIDDRLNEVSKNLEDAEEKLSKFKSQSKIVEIDEQSKQLVEFIANLENEKFKNDLEISVYENKLENIIKKMNASGYVDQTYLTPEQYQNTSSPFSDLLSQLTRLEIQKLELLQKRTELHPDVILLTEQIEKIKTELVKFNQNTVTAYQIIASTLKQKQLEIKSLIEKYSEKIKQLPNQEAELAGLIRTKDAYEKMYTLLLDKREEMRVAELSRMQDLIILDPAVEPIKPISPNKKLNLALAVIFGFVVGLFIVGFVQISDNKLNDIRDIENEFNYPILSVIPPYEKKIAEKINSTEVIREKFIIMYDELFRYREAYRTLETKLFSKINGSPKKIMITSCEENAGKTSAASNLAIAAAQSGKKVLLIDCDIKNPSLADQFGLPKFSSGLVDYLLGKIDVPNIYKPVKLTNNSNLLINLDVIPTGEFVDVSGEILASERMHRFIKEIDYYDFVIFDTPPITRLSDALSLGRIIKDTLLVVRAGQTIKESISWAISELKTSEINFHGLLVNDCEVSPKSYKYQYGYNFKKS